MKVENRKRKATKRRSSNTKRTHAALDRVHAAAKKSGADGLTDEEIDDLIAAARTKKTKSRGKS